MTKDLTPREHERTASAGPPISVVVPLFNKAAYIRRTLESIRRQTWTRFEVIVVDDGSTDRGGVIAANFADPRFRVVVQANAGEGAARNRGIAESSANLIAFLDADDEWEPDFLQAVVSLSARYPGAGILATGYRRLCGDGSEVRVSVRPGRGETTRLIRNYFRAVREGEFVTSSSVALRRPVLDRVGGFVEREPAGADRDLWARISLHYPIAYDTRLLAVYHSEAEGRAYGSPTAIHRYPPAARSLRALAASGVLSREQKNRALAFADWLIWKHAFDIAFTRDRRRLLELLGAEEFGSPYRRIRARLLWALAAIVPPRMIAALKLKPQAVARAMRGTPMLAALFTLKDAICGRTVALRTTAAARPALDRIETATETGR